MQLDDDNPKEDLWLAHWVKTAFNHRKVIGQPETLKLGLAVSGGSDSMAMLHLFARHAAEAQYQLEAATVDHGLRPEAAEEAQFVASICNGLDIAHQTLPWTGWNGTGNVQAQARAARYTLLAEWARDRGLDCVLIAHTQDDVAETFLMRLARGSGLDGLAAMEKMFTRNGVTFARPLIQLEREMLRRHLRRHGYEWRDDPSNEDRRYQRVRARDALKALQPMGIDTGQLVSAAYDLALAKNALKMMVWECADKIVVLDGGDIVLPRSDHLALSPEISRRLLSSVLQWQGGTEYPPRADSWIELNIAVHAQKRHTLNGCLISGTQEEIRIAREYSAVTEVSCATTEIWDGRWSLDGPHSDRLKISALGEDGVRHCPDWREAGLPRASLLASPAVWRGSELVAAPLAGLANGWCATLTRSREQFLSGLLSH